MKIKFFKKEKKFKKESLRLSLGIYWKASVCFMFVVAILSSFFGYYLFMKTNKELVLEMDGTISQVETIKKERISKVLEYFSIREQKSNEILNSPAPVIDPSL